MDSLRLTAVVVQWCLYNTEEGQCATMLNRFGFSTLDFMAFRQKEWGVVKQHQVSGTLGQLQLSEPRMIDNVRQDTPPMNFSDDL